MDKSYFYYRGSYATPPCHEGVERFIMETPIIATPETIRDMKEKSLNRLLETTNNARKPRKF